MTLIIENVTCFRPNTGISYTDRFQKIKECAKKFDHQKFHFAKHFEAVGLFTRTQNWNKVQNSEKEPVPEGRWPPKTSLSRDSFEQLNEAWLRLPNNVQAERHEKGAAEKKISLYAQKISRKARYKERR